MSDMESNKKLAEIDLAIADAVVRRAALVEEIGEGPGPAIESDHGSVTRAAMSAVFREVEAATRSAAKRMRVAYLGPEDSFSHLTAIERFGEASELIAVATIGSVFNEVASGGCERGVVPLENSTHGRVTDTLEAFSTSEVRVCGEAPMRIHHCLLGKGQRSAIREVHSKPQALAQCGRWLAEHMPGVETHPAASTSDAARLASDKPGVAAIASEQAGRRQGLEVLARNIEDQKDNLTRFAVIGLEAAPATGDDKTALMMEIAHEPGSLADAMAIFKRHELNMTWIESFPIPSSHGRYLFFVEFLGHQSDSGAAEAIAALEAACVRLRVLGSYARSEALG